MDLLNHSAPGASNPAASLVCFSDGSDGGLALSIESHRSMPAPFLTKTYQLVDDPTTNHIVSWGEDNTTFVVWRPADFARDLLPNYFKHNNFSSFVRQLNTYGFRKIVPDRWEFANEFFRKGEKHLLCEIHRRKTAPNNRCSPTNSSEELMMQQQVASPWSPAQLAAAHAASPISSPRTAAAFAVAAAHHMGMQQAATARNMQHRIGNFSGGPSCTGPSAGALSLSDENERLRRDNTLLLSELTRMRKLYHDVLLYVQHQNAARTSTAAYCNAASRIESPSGSFHMAVPATPSAANLMLQAPVSSLCGAGSNGSTEFPLARVTTPVIACASNGRSLETTVIPFNLAARKREMSVSNLYNGERQSAADQSSSTPLGVELRANLNPKPAMCAPRAEDSNGAAAGENCTSSFCNVRDSATAERSPPRLFGVPLKWCKKRPMGGATDEDDEDERREDHHVMLCSMKSNKKSNIGGAASMSLELSKEPTGAPTLQGNTSSSNNMHAGPPWLKFNANRDEQVYN